MSFLKEVTVVDCVTSKRKNRSWARSVSSEVQRQPADQPTIAGSNQIGETRSYIPPILVDAFEGVVGFLKKVCQHVTMRTYTVTKRKAHFIFQANYLGDCYILMNVLKKRKLSYFTCDQQNAYDLKCVSVCDMDVDNLLCLRCGGPYFK